MDDNQTPDVSPTLAEIERRNRVNLAIIALVIFGILGLLVWFFMQEQTTEEPVAAEPDERAVHIERLNGMMAEEFTPTQEQIDVLDAMMAAEIEVADTTPTPDSAPVSN